MKPTTVAAVVVAVFVLAFAAGRLTAPKVPLAAPAAVVSSDDKDANDDNDSAAPTNNRGLGVGATSARLDGAGASRAAEAPGAPGVVTAARLEFLEREVARLEKMVDVQQAVVKETDGVVIAFPEGHTPAGDQEKLMTTLQEQMKAQGLAGDITAIDCSEFPCIAHGSIAGINDAALEGVVAGTTKALEGLPYAGFNRFVDAQDPTKNKTTFSLSVFPAGLPEAEQQNLNKRLRARKNAFVE